MAAETAVETAQAYLTVERTAEAAAGLSSFCSSAADAATATVVAAAKQ
jgi:hypothetical protein